MEATRHQAKVSLIDTIKCLGGIHINPATNELTASSADSLDHEHVLSQKSQAYY